MTYSASSFGVPAIARATARNADNNTGSTIPKFMPVKVTSLGMGLIDISSEADVDAFSGVTNSSVPDGSSGVVVTAGQVYDTGLSYAPGTILYVSKSGGISDSKPTVGVDGFVQGDYSIRIGVVVENASNPSLRDVILMISTIGQL